MSIGRWWCSAGWLVGLDDLQCWCLVCLVSVQTWCGVWLVITASSCCSLSCPASPRRSWPDTEPWGVGGSPESHTPTPVSCKTVTISDHIEAPVLTGYDGHHYGSRPRRVVIRRKIIPRQRHRPNTVAVIPADHRPLAVLPAQDIHPVAGFEEWTKLVKLFVTSPITSMTSSEFGSEI